MRKRDYSLSSRLAVCRRAAAFILVLAFVLSAGLSAQALAEPDTDTSVSGEPADTDVDAPETDGDGSGSPSDDGSDSEDDIYQEPEPDIPSDGEPDTPADVPADPADEPEENPGTDEEPETGIRTVATSDEFLEALDNLEVTDIVLADAIQLNLASAALIEPGRSLSIDLAGKTLDIAGAGTGMSELLDVRGTLVLKDTAAGGRLTFSNAVSGMNVSTGSALLTIESGTIELGDNTGRAVCAHDGAIVLMTGGVIQSASSRAVPDTGSLVDGGAVALAGSGTSMVLSGTIRNTMAANGGAVYVADGASLTLEKSIPVDGSGENLPVIQGCAAAGSGGAVAVFEGSAEFRCGTLTENTAGLMDTAVELSGSGDGGAVWIGEHGTLTTNAPESDSLAITQNAARNQGGGIWAALSGSLDLQGWADIVHNEPGDLFPGTTPHAETVRIGAPEEDQPAEPSDEPSIEPSQQPTEEPTAVPTEEPTEEQPSEEPTAEPSREPDDEPSEEPDNKIDTYAELSEALQHDGAVLLEGDIVVNTTEAGTLGSLEVPNGVSPRLILNGHSITGTMQPGENLIDVYGSLSIQNQRGTGEVSGQGSLAVVSGSSAIYVHEGASLDAKDAVFHIGSRAERAVTVDGGGSASLTSCAITGRGTAQYGGAVLADGSAYPHAATSLHLASVQISDTQAVYGGAVSAIRASVQLTGGSSIRDCSAVAQGNMRAAQGAGGAVFISAGDLTIDNAEITGCEAASSGGAIYLEDGSVNVVSGTISSCKANGGNGGAINAESGTVTLGDAEISNCTAARNGGALYLASHASATVSSSSGAPVIKDNAALQGEGGAVYLEAGAQADLGEADLSGNTAAGTTSDVAGPGMQAADPDPGAAQVSTWDELKEAFKQGTAKIQLAGNIELNSIEANVNQLIVESPSNIVLDLAGHTLTVMDNGPLEKEGPHLIRIRGGGAIFELQDSSAPSTGKISYGDADNIIYVEAGGTFSLAGGTLQPASGTRRAVLVSGGSFVMSGGAIRGLANKEESPDYAGGVWVIGGSAVLSGGEITGTYAKKNGGAIRVQGGGQLTLQETVTIENCGSGGNGGAIFATGNGSQVSMNGGSISGCSAGTEGGGIAMGNGTNLEMTGGLIADCVAKTNGGGVMLGSGNSATMTFSGGSITGCSAVNGGGIATNSVATELQFTGGSIDGCAASGTGGGVYVKNAKTIAVGNLHGSAVPSITNCEANVVNGIGGIGCEGSKASVVTLSGYGLIINNEPENLAGGIARPPSPSFVVGSDGSAMSSYMKLALTLATLKNIDTSVAAVEEPGGEDGEGSYVVELEPEQTLEAKIGDDLPLCIPSGKSVMLDLAGNTITCTGTDSEVNFFTVSGAGTLLTIQNGKLQFKGGDNLLNVVNDAVAELSDDAELEVMGGNTTRAVCAGAGLSGGGTFRMKGESPTVTILRTDPGNGYGGALMAAGTGTLDLENGTITGPNTDGGTQKIATAQMGGAVYVANQGSLNIQEGATISGFHASVDGGAIYLAKNSTLTTTGGKVQGNSARRNGGGIYITADAAMYALAGGSSEPGAGIQIQGNTAFGKADEPEGQGGGLYLAGTNYDLQSGRVFRNKPDEVFPADVEHGAWFIIGNEKDGDLTPYEELAHALRGEKPAEPWTYLTVTDSTITFNSNVEDPITADNVGGTVTGEEDESYTIPTLDVPAGASWTIDFGTHSLVCTGSKDVFRSLFNVQGTLTLTGSAGAAVKYGYEDSSAGDYVICVPDGSQGSVTLQGSIAIKRGHGLASAVYAGSGSYFRMTESASIEGAILDKVSVLDPATDGKYDGGAIRLKGEGLIGGMASIHGTLARMGGAVWVDGGKLTLQENATIHDCEAIGSGGAVYLAGGGSMTMNGGEITECAAGSRGNPPSGFNANGGAIVIAGNGTLDFAGGTIKHCYVSDKVTKDNHGGGICVRSGSVTMSDEAILSDCHAKTGGGIAVYPNDSDTAKFRMTGGHISNCQAGTPPDIDRGDPVADAFGGGIYADGSGATVEVLGPEPSGTGSDKTYSAKIENCLAMADGGGMYLTGCQQVRISGLELRACQAPRGRQNNYHTTGGHGGGIYVKGGDSALTLNDTFFYRCGANVYGGGIYAEADVQIGQQKSCTFTECSSTNRYGGAVMMASHTVNLSRSSITGCTAGQNGGAIYLGSIPESGDAACHAVLGVEASNDTNTFLDTVRSWFGVSKADQGAGDSDVEITKCMAQGGAGGGIYVAGGSSLELTGVVSITGNQSAGYAGGGIYAASEGTPDGAQSLVFRGSGQINKNLPEIPCRDVCPSKLAPEAPETPKSGYDLYDDDNKTVWNGFSIQDDKDLKGLLELIKGSASNGVSTVTIDREYNLSSTLGLTMDVLRDEQENDIKNVTLKFVRGGRITGSGQNEQGQLSELIRVGSGIHVEFTGQNATGMPEIEAGQYKAGTDDTEVWGKFLIGQETVVQVEDDGTLRLDGPTISGGSSTLNATSGSALDRGGQAKHGVTVSGTFIMSSGTIQNCGWADKYLSSSNSDATQWLIEEGTTGGGLVVNEGGAATISGGEFKQNGAARGCAVYVGAGGEATIYGGEFHANGTPRTHYGGAIAVEGDGAALDITGRMGSVARFYDNRARYGGAIAIIRTQDDVTSKTREGSPENVSIEYAEIGTGGIKEHFDFGSNSSRVTAQADDPELSTSTINGNVATYGGGLYIDTTNSVSLKHVSVQSNCSTNGGGMYIWSGKVTLNEDTHVWRNGTMSGNSMPDQDNQGLYPHKWFGNGGGIYVGGYHATQDASLYLTGNAQVYRNATTAHTIDDPGAAVHSQWPGNGGGIYLAAGGSAYLQDKSLVRGNFAWGKGGGIFVDSGAILDFSDHKWSAEPPDDWTTVNTGMYRAVLYNRTTGTMGLYDGTDNDNANYSLIRNVNWTGSGDLDFHGYDAGQNPGEVPSNPSALPSFITPQASGDGSKYVCWPQLVGGPDNAPTGKQLDDWINEEVENGSRILRLKDRIDRYITDNKDDPELPVGPGLKIEPREDGTYVYYVEGYIEIGEDGEEGAQDIVLDLQGCEISGDRLNLLGSAQNTIFRIYKGSRLTLMDSTQESSNTEAGRIAREHPMLNSLIEVREGEFVMKSGTLTNKGHHAVRSVGGRVTITDDARIVESGTGLEPGGGVMIIGVDVSASDTGSEEVPGAEDTQSLRMSRDADDSDAAEVQPSSPPAGGQDWCRLEISGNALLKNNQGNFGGAIYSTAPGGTLIRSMYTPNYAAFAPGGTRDHTVGQSGVRIVGNTARNGGGVWARDLTMDGGLVQDNTALWGGGRTGQGGGLFVDHEFYLYRGTICQNIARNVGGGIYVNWGTDALIDGAQSNPPAVQIIDNAAQDTLYDSNKSNHGHAGGGIFLEHNLKDAGTDADGNATFTDPEYRTLLTIYRAYITKNEAVYGGGLAYCAKGSATMLSLDGPTIYDNKLIPASPPYGDTTTTKRAQDKSTDVLCDGAGALGLEMVEPPDAVGEPAYLANWQGYGAEAQGHAGTVIDFNKNTTADVEEPQTYWSFGVTNDLWKAPENTDDTYPGAVVTSAEQNSLCLIQRNYSRTGGGGIGGNGTLVLGAARQREQVAPEFKIQKVVSSPEGITAPAQTFKFKLWEFNGQKWNQNPAQVYEVMTPAPAGGEEPMYLPALASAGTRTYVLEESNDLQDLPGSYERNTQQYWLEVTVGSVRVIDKVTDEETGEETEEESYHLGLKEIRVYEASGDAEIGFTRGELLSDKDPTLPLMEFTNTYNPGTANSDIAVSKTVRIQPGLALDLTGTIYKFTLTPKNGAPLPDNPPAGAVVAADGSMSQQLVWSSAGETGEGAKAQICEFGNFSFDEAGEYVYTLQEEAVQAPAGWTCVTPAPHTLAFTVSSQTPTGELAVTSVRLDGASVPIGDARYTVDFVNVYERPNTPDTPSTIFGPRVEKKIQGTLNGNETFTFVMKASPETPNAPLPGNPTVSIKGAGTAWFPGTQYDSAGTYKYEITEVPGSTQGVTYDRTVWVVTVTVSNTSDGPKVTSVTYDDRSAGGAGKTHAVFTNRIDEPADTTVRLTGRKLLQNADGTSHALTAGEFTFLLRPAESNPPADPVREETTLTNGTDGSFTILDGAVYTEQGEYNYTVSEEFTGEGGIQYSDAVYDIVVTVTGKDGNLSAEIGVTDKDGNEVNLSDLQFKNEYNPDEISVPISGIKILEGGILEGGDFTFVIEPVSSSEDVEIPMPASSTASNFASGLFQFGSITYTTPGEYIYHVQERLGDVDGVTYDDQVYTVVVRVDRDENGALQAVVDIEEAESIVFTNTEDEPKDATVRLIGHKILSTTEGADHPLKAGEFSFLLTPSAANPPDDPVSGEVVLTNSADGGINILDGVTYKSPGDYVYTLIEQFTGEAGMQYSDAAYTITVNVIEEAGTLTAAVTVTDKDGNKVDPAEIRFENEYDADKTAVTISGTKILEGGVLEPGAFTFAIEPVSGPDGSEVPVPSLTTTTNLASGVFQFGHITYTKPGVYTYHVYEEGGSLPGIVYDDQVYTVVVRVDRDENGALRATVEVEDAENIVFTNVKEEKDVTVNLTGQKVLQVADGMDHPLTAGEFSFLLTPAPANPQGDPISGEVVLTNAADGTFSILNGITYKDPGEYNYTLIEQFTGEAGMQYSDAAYTITVNVTEQNGTVVAATTATDKDGNDVDLSAIRFENEYDENKTSVTIPGLKVLEGGTLAAGSFIFVIEPVSGPESGNIPVPSATTTTNLVSGVFQFGHITYTKPGVYAYHVYEQGGGLTGIIYDSRVYTVVVSVDQDANGVLQASVRIDDADRITFTNKVEQGEPSLVLDKEHRVNNGNFTKDPQQVSPGDRITYRITVRNTSSAVSPGTIVTDDVPDRLMIVDGSISNGGVLTNGVITWNVGNLGPGEEKVVSFEVIVPSDAGNASWKNIATVTYDTPNGPKPGPPSNPVDTVPKGYGTNNGSTGGTATRTGDDTNLGLWVLTLIAAGAAGGGAFWLYRRARRRQRSNE